MAKLQILSAKPGVFKRGKFKALKRNARRNISEGFHDSKGVFHPIRHAPDYDPDRAGESGKKKRPAKKKAAAKKKTAKKKPAVKRAAKAKSKGKKGKR